MSWRITEHPEGGLQIIHDAAPRFSARWTTGEFPIGEVSDGAFFWTDEGSGGEDAIHLFAFSWVDTASDKADLELLMQAAAAQIDRWIMDGQ